MSILVHNGAQQYLNISVNSNSEQISEKKELWPSLGRVQLMLTLSEALGLTLGSTNFPYFPFPISNQSLNHKGATFDC